MIYRTAALRLGLLAATTLLSGPYAKATLIIDSFNDFQMINVRNAGSDTNTSIASDPGIVGGQRELFLERDPSAGTPGGSNGRLISDSGILSLITAASQRTRAMITYDGAGGSDTATGTFLGNPNQFLLDEALGMDANFHNHGVQFSLKIVSDQSLPLTITVYDETGATFVRRSLTIPVGDDTVDVLFSTFTGTGVAANVFDNVGAITLALGRSDFLSNKGASAEISFLAITQVPEPGTLAVVGIALVGFGSTMRRRYKA